LNIWVENEMLIIFFLQKVFADVRFAHGRSLLANAALCIPRRVGEFFMGIMENNNRGGSLIGIGVMTPISILLLPITLPITSIFNGMDNFR
jgi:hypothetical protein